MAAAAQPPLLPSAIAHSPARGGLSSGNMSVLVTGSSSSSSNGPSASEFGARAFDPRAWINTQLEATRSSQPTPAATTGTSSLQADTAHLSQLLMKLNLMAADINSTMEIQSQELVQQMPKAMREIAFIHRESQSLRVNLSDILRDMATIEHTKPSSTTAASSVVVATTPSVASPVAGDATAAAAAAAATGPASAASTIDFLHGIDVVKTRIERCAGTLEELDRWAKRERLVEQLFERLTGPAAGSEVSVLPAAGDAAFQDLARIHTELANMRAIIDRFRTLGVAAVESDARAANLAAYERKLLVMAQLLQEQTMDSLVANSALSSLDDESGPVVSATTVSHLRILRSVFGSNSAAFESTYQSGKLKATLSKLLEKYAAAAGKKSSTGTSQFEVKQLDEWLEIFLLEVVRFTRDEISFAQQAFGSASDAAAASALAASTEAQPDAPKLLASDSSDSSSALVGEAAPQPTSAFIYSAVLAVLHAELIPLLSVWFNAYLAAHKGSDAVPLLLRLWEQCCTHIGWGLAQLMLLPTGDDAEVSVSSVELSSRQRLVLELVSQPFARYLVDYAPLEKKVLFATLDLMSFGGDSYDLLSANVAEMQRVVVRTQADALTRCKEISQGTLIEPLVTAMAEYFTEVAQRLFSLLRRLRRIAGLDGTSAAATPQAVAKSSKSPAGSPNPADGQESASAAADATQQFASFQGAFGLLRTCRALQWDLFSPHAEEALLARVCTPDMIGVVRAAEDEVKDGPRSTSTTPASRRHSAAAPQPPAQLKTRADLTKLLALSFLAHHPDRLKSLSAFLSTHCAHLYAVTNSADAAHGTQGLHAHGHPATPLVGVASPGVSGASRGKYGFPTGASSPSAALSTSAAAASSSSLFASSSALFDSFISALHNLILDTMFKPIGARLASFHEWSSIWAAKQTTSGMLSSIPLPAFSLQPSEYIISIGEHLLTLVQQMEPFVHKQDDEDDQEDGGLVANASTHAAAPLQAQSLLVGAANAPPPVYLEHDALYWLGLLSRGTFKHLCSSIHQLSVLSERGAKQLACDLEYLVNVLGALGLTIPSLVLKLQVWLAWSEQQALQHLGRGQAGEEWRLDELTPDEKHMLRQVLKTRRFAAIAADKQIQASINA